MCGIGFAINNDKTKVNGVIKSIYEQQKHRGTQGFGFVEITDEELKHHTFVLEKDMLDALEKSGSNHILFHHRIPTSTTNNVVSNHPIFTDWEGYKHNYYMVHNGHIRNCDELKKEHEKYGIEYNTNEGNMFTDSESLLHELALIVEEIKDYKDFKAEGGLAFIMVQTDKLNNPIALYYGRNTNDLKVQQMANCFVLRSECHTGEEVPSNILHRYDYDTKEITKKEVPFGKAIVPVTIPMEMEKDVFADVVMDLYENRYITYFALKKLTKQQLFTFLIISRRLFATRSMELEKKLLTSSKEELMMLRSFHNNISKSIDNVERLLK